MYKTNFNIPGTISSTQTFQLVVSSGIPSLDKLLGGGLPVGTLTLIEEDTQGTYARIILKYFLAEGAVNKHDIFVATQEMKPRDIVTHLPALVLEDRTDAKTTQGDKMKIAFRYSNLPTSETNVRHEFGHYFDLSSTISKDVLGKINIHYWSKENCESIILEGGCFKNPAYRDLLEVIKTKIENGKYFLKDGNSSSNILKIGIYGLGSPLWMSNCDKDSIADLNKFLYCLKALLKSSLAAAVVTIPTHLYDKFAVNKFRSTSDISLRLQALAGTELEHNKYLSDYHGYFHIDKIAAINTFVSKHPGAIEHMFKLRRKKFTIEVLHLPPDLEVSQDKKVTPSLGCASNTKHLLEF
ncbi:pax6 neighbor protein paxneb [Holotrichia oblita]|uniref:Pax6 neighbor protein paxneb n=1 Tax=Holotrichia oblita TaxID=644536 RepID=A0ACB9SQF6_HOLOL|nr:pax6 neighbor protein paxneb [Holotrichia oblita]